METIFMNTKSSKTSQLPKFVLNLSQRLEFRNSNKHVVFQNLAIHYTCKKINTVVQEH